MADPVPRPVGAGIACWSIHHPVGVIMITLAVMVLGLFALDRLNIDLLPHLIYPDIRVRVEDPGVPATVMEDEITRQLEEQLAITEDAIHVQSRTSEGRSSVDLSFGYGKDIDLALRDASTRLDRAKRFLPDSINPPIIYKRDPFQLPVADFVVSSPLRDPIELRTWADYSLGKLLLNLPGVAAAEVGGGLVQEIQVLADQDRLAGLGLDILDVSETLEQANQDIPAGRLLMQRAEITGRTAGRFRDLQEITTLPLTIKDSDGQPHLLPLGELAQVVDGAKDEHLNIRYNSRPGIKLSIQKQPLANTVTVVETVNAELERLKDQGQIPPDITVDRVDDQARYIRQSLRNAIYAASSGAMLAMLVVYIFLGSLRRTLIIGSAIPIAILVTFILMASGGFTLNIMTLGGLALGIGMLVDSTIVMLENIYRHQRAGRGTLQAAGAAAGEVTSAIVASTSTNLAAVLPFLFISGLIGLLFRELIFTISAAILASMIVALTLIPALAGRVSAGAEGLLRRLINGFIERLQNGYGRVLAWILRIHWLIIPLFIAGLVLSVYYLVPEKFLFLPKLDEGRITVRVTADRGINLDEMDAITRRFENLLAQEPAVVSLYTTVGGFVFGRSEFTSANRASIKLQLGPLAERNISSQAWIDRLQPKIDKMHPAGVKVRIYTRGIRGIRFNWGEDDLSLRIKGPDLKILEHIADQALERLEEVKGLRNIQHSNQEVSQELSVRVDRERAASLGLTVEDVGKAVRFALRGSEITDFIHEDRSIDVLLRLNRSDVANPADLESVILFSKTEPRVPVRVADIAQVEIVAQPASIQRDRQQRVVEVTASLTGEAELTEVIPKALRAIADLDLPPGYVVYEAGGLQTMQEGQDLSRLLLGLALFLVLVVMAVQYESLRNPLIIIFSVPFAAIGVGLGLEWTQLPLSMPVWLGLIMLAGIVVNNAIVLVEYIEIQRRHHGLNRQEAIVAAARLRLRPILMTTLTTVVGMSPLALAWGEGSEMLQPLAVTIVSGLSFSTLVTLVLVPVTYRLLGRPDPA